jgi:hypothetical protein
VCFSDGCYTFFFDLDTLRDHVTSAGFVEVDLTTAQRDRGTSSRGSRPFGAKVNHT